MSAFPMTSAAPAKSDRALRLVSSLTYMQAYMLLQTLAAWLEFHTERNPLSEAEIDEIMDMSVILEDHCEARRLAGDFPGHEALIARGFGK